MAIRRSRLSGLSVIWENHADLGNTCLWQAYDRWNGDHGIEAQVLTRLSL
jgi:hypothetical protein